MSDQAIIETREEDRDALHVLPLSILPLQTPSLRRARLIKNVRLQSVVELFVDEGGTGSGQMDVEHLSNQFGWDPHNPHPDLVLMRKLAPLPSYDVYSLRILFRSMGIKIDDIKDLNLSPNKVKELTKYMTTFTYPLIHQIYGEDDVNIKSFGDVVGLFTDPDIIKVREKLQQMSEKLGIKMSEVPTFLEDYGDVFLSLSYYRQCMDDIEPIMDEFLDAIDELRHSYQFKQNQNLIETCSVVESTINSMMAAISGRFETFERYTTDMWKNLDAARFKKVKRFIEDYHLTIGGCLCSITVKLNAWAISFPHADAGGPARRAEFLVSEMKQGIDKLREIEAQAPKVEVIDWDEPIA